MPSLRLPAHSQERLFGSQTRQEKAALEVPRLRQNILPQGGGFLIDILDLIADQIKHIKDNTRQKQFGVRHEIVEVLESMRIVLQQHEALLLYAHKTLDLDYHRRADEIYKTFQAKIDEDEKLNLPSEERLVRVKRFGLEARDARERLDEEFNIGEEAS